MANVEREYAKNKQLKKGEVDDIRRWTDERPHLPKIDELDAILFLHSCDYDVEAAKTCVDTFYTTRAHCPEFFANRDPVANSSEIFDLLLYCPLARRTVEGFQVIFCKMIDANVERYNFSSQVKVFDMATMLMLHQEGTSPGQIILTDMKGVSFSHITKLRVDQIRKFFYYLQNAMPVRLKGIHFFNIPTFMDKLISMIKPFLKGDLISILHLHTENLETLHKFVPKDYLPRDYGGDGDSIAELLEKRRKNFLDNADYFRKEETLVADESKRLGKGNGNEMFDVEGSLKKLNID